jgi:hypothetical protein
VRSIRGDHTFRGDDPHKGTDKEGEPCGVEEIALPVKHRTMARELYDLTCVYLIICPAVRTSSAEKVRHELHNQGI